MATLLGILAATLTCAAALLRLTVTIRATSVSGVSAGYIWLGLISNTGWLWYGIIERLPAQTVPSLVWLAVLIYILTRLHREHSQRPTLGPAGLAITAMTATAFISPTLVGSISGVLGITSGIPQAVRIWRTKDPHGVGPTAWAFSLFMSAVWAGYGLIAGLTPVWATNALFALLVLIVLAGYARAVRDPAPTA